MKRAWSLIDGLIAIERVVQYFLVTGESFIEDTIGFRGECKCLLDGIF